MFHIRGACSKIAVFQIYITSRSQQSNRAMLGVCGGKLYQARRSSAKPFPEPQTLKARFKGKVLRSRVQGNLTPLPKDLSSLSPKLASQVQSFGSDRIDSFVTTWATGVELTMYIYQSLGCSGGGEEITKHII